MPRVFRQQYTKPIPEGAVRTTTTLKRRGKSVEVEAVQFKGEDGRQVVAPVVQSGKHAGKHCRVASPTWYGRVGGVAVPLCSNKQAAEMMLADKIRQREREGAGLRDPFEAHKNRALADHLADFERELTARSRAPRYIELTISRLRALFAGCGFAYLRDLDADKVTAWLLEQRRTSTVETALPSGQQDFRLEEVAVLLGIPKLAVAPWVTRHGLQANGQGKARRFPRATVEALLALRATGMSTETANQYQMHAKSFANWLVRTKKLPANPLAHLSRANADTDRRHARRELSEDELRRLLATTKASPRTFRGLSGNDRYHLYALACGTGFRAGALGSLTPECFELDGRYPTVTLAVRSDKSRRGKIQPLPADVAELMRSYLADKPTGQPVWGGTWANDRAAAMMLRRDLQDCNIPYSVAGPNGPLFADFHALRHTYLTLGGRAGIDLRTLQELAGHSTPTLTARYSHRRLHDLAGAVEKLPSVLPKNPSTRGHSDSAGA